MSPYLNYSKGFSLIEMALVMLIMGSLLSGLLVALTQTSENTRRTTAKNQLSRIEEALYAYAQANGRLPCPASSTSEGYEDPNDGSGDCTNFHGFVPNATLSLYGRINPDGLMLDPWSNPYRYSVAEYPVAAETFNTTGNPGFTNQTALKDDVFNGDPSIPDNTADAGGTLDDSGTYLLQVCDIWDCSGTTYTVNAPAIVLSMGKNWSDEATNEDCGTVLNTNEVENAGGEVEGDYCITDTNRFVDTEYNQDSYDDILIWLSPYVLFSRMISAGQLP